MKHCVIALAALLVAASTFAQGTVNFVNKITGTLDARVFYANNGSPIPADGDFMAQLYAGPAGTAESALVATGAAVAFRSTPDSGKGYWPGAARTIAGVAENGTAAVQVRAWKSSEGATWEAAVAKGGGFGSSAVLTIPTGGGLNPATPLTGLASFNISNAAAIPEPAVAALGLLGAGLLVIRRKK